MGSVLITSNASAITSSTVQVQGTKRPRGSSARLGGTDVYLDEDLPDSVDDNDNNDNDDDNYGVGTTIMVLVLMKTTTMMMRLVNM